MAAVLEIRGLHKTYRGVFGRERKALDGFEMTVEAGEVHGFLGPNGSGKTTTLRTLLGLIRPDAGEMVLLGRTVPENLPGVIAEVGAIVESPQFFPHFSARDTLSLLADAGDVPQRRVDEVLEIVGLRDRAKDKVRTYSLGMKQRLAVASALLRTPRLLILDEPANGLDPGGIREMRDLMRALAANGMTVILSSHILGEVEQICDSVTIISRGRRVTAGSVAQVLAANSTAATRVRTEHPTQLATAAGFLIQAGATVDSQPDHLLVTGALKPAEINRVLAVRDIYASELTAVTADLESVFLQLTETAPVAGHARQVDESIVVAPEVAA